MAVSRGLSAETFSNYCYSALLRPFTNGTVPKNLKDYYILFHCNNLSLTNSYLLPLTNQVSCILFNCNNLSLFHEIKKNSLMSSFSAAFSHFSATPTKIETPHPCCHRYSDFIGSPVRTIHCFQFRPILLPANNTLQTLLR